MKLMNKIFAGSLATALLGGFALPAAAEVSASASIATSYLWRGYDLGSGTPAAIVRSTTWRRMSAKSRFGANVPSKSNNTASGDSSSIMSYLYLRTGGEPNGLHEWQKYVGENA